MKQYYVYDSFSLEIYTTNELIESCNYKTLFLTMGEAMAYALADLKSLYLNDVETIKETCDELKKKNIM